MKKFALILVLLMGLASAQARAQTQIVSPIETLAKQAIIVEAGSGDVLYEKEADAKMPTSSMSKIMTMYLVFEAMKHGKLNMDSMITISSAAREQSGSRMFVNIGEQVRAEDLCRGVIIQSGNDAAVALAEAVSGTEASFAELMNAKAKELGLTNSHFKNATGLPDPDHYSTARDLANLAIALMRDFPQHYHFYGETEFTYNNIKQGNRNPLLYRNMGVDGMKTGHTDIAGYGLIASALREGRRVMTVVNGLSSMQERADEPAKLIEWAYREYGLYSYLPPETAVGEAKVWLGQVATVKVAPQKSVSFTLPRSEKENVKIAYTVNTETVAPIAKGDVVGKAVVTAPHKAPVEVPLVAVEDVQKLGFFKTLWAKFLRLIGRE